MLTANQLSGASLQFVFACFQSTLIGIPIPGICKLTDNTALLATMQLLYHGLYIYSHQL